MPFPTPEGPQKTRGGSSAEAAAPGARPGEEPEATTAAVAELNERPRSEEVRRAEDSIRDMMEEGKGGGRKRVAGDPWGTRDSQQV